MPIQSWFPTSIYVEPLLPKPHRFNRELVEQCHLIRETDSAGREWSETNYIGGYTSYGSISDLHRHFPHFAELEKNLNRHVAKFARFLDMDLQGGKLKMVNCWVNVMPTFVTHSLHLHPLSVVSGTYYASVPKNASSLKFEDPRLSRFMASPPKVEGARPRNLPFVSIQPKVGHVALWESWLRHEVPPNRSKQERISVSFNYDWV